MKKVLPPSLTHNTRNTHNSQHSQQLQQEIRDTDEIGTLFRSNDVVTKMLSAHARVIGRLFLVDVLRPPIEQILLNMDDVRLYYSLFCCAFNP